MNYITADDLLLSRLGGFIEPIEIRSPEGKVMGRYVPVIDAETAALYQQAHTLFDLKECERGASLGQSGSSLDEVMSHIRALPVETERNTRLSGCLGLKASWLTCG